MPGTTDRCPECGSRRSTWSRGVILAAIHAHTDSYGVPPKHDQWRYATPEHPSSRTVREMFGGWSAALETAGVKPRRHAWDRDTIKRAIFEWVYEHGQPPTTTEWTRTCPEGKHPSVNTVVSRFGSWSTAIRESGYEPRRQSKGGDVRPRGGSGKFVAA